MRLLSGILIALALASGPVRGGASPWAKIGLGSGITYGGLGVGAEAGLSRLAVVAGAGALFREFGWAAGGRVYALASARAWQPHLTLVYGTTLSYKIRIYDIIEERVVRTEEGTIRGFGIYLGADHRLFRGSGMLVTLGLGYLTHEELPVNVAEMDIDSHFKALVGLGWRFGS